MNEVCGHTSTGKISVALANEFIDRGHEVKIAFGRDNFIPKGYESNVIRIGNSFDVKAHAIMTRITDRHGLGSKRATRNFLRWLDDFNPELIWLHNIHGYYINYEMLFNWIKKHDKIKVKWTLHDCWAFTGHCTHYEYIKCERWQKGCYNCPQKKEYPSSIIMDNSKDNYQRKKLAFSGIADMTIITPSNWLASQVCKSFLHSYKIEVIHNDIDRKTFKPRRCGFGKKYGLENKRILLGVSNVWNERKGLQDFMKLSSLIDEKYIIVLVGLKKNQLKRLPKRIVGIEKTEDQKELAGIYSEADWFINLTYEDTYPTVNLEAEACGTRVITYDSGGAPETIKLKESKVIRRGDIWAILEQL